MKCKICNDEINLSIFLLPKDTCYGCASKETKKEVLNANIKENIHFDLLNEEGFEC
jgi:hypothetical protein